MFKNLIIWDDVFSCGCGRLRDEHHDRAKVNEVPSGVTWNVSEHTETDGPTDAFGELEFTGAGQASRAKVGYGHIMLRL